MERALQGENEAYLSNELKTHGLLRAVHEKIRTIAITDIEKVVRKDDVTGLPIVPVEQTVVRLINMFRILRRCGLDILPSSELAAILETCLRVNAVFDTIKTFDSGVITALGTPNTVHQIAAQTDAVAQAAFQTLGIIIAKTFCLGEYFNDQIEGAGEHFAKIMSLSFEAQETLANVQKLARYEATNTFGATFEQEAKRYNTATWSWTLSAVAFCGIGISNLAISQHKILSAASSVASSRLYGVEFLQVTISAFLFFAMAFCAKSAVTHRNNYIISRHRKVVLDTANLFAEASGNDAVKLSIFEKAVNLVADSKDLI